MTGPFANDEEEEEEEDKIDKWYTSTNNHSAAYALLHLLYMDSSKVNIINNMSAEQIWQSHPLFRSYPIDDFKKYNANMKKLTKTKRRVIVEDEGIFHQDMNNVVLLKGVGKLYVKINAKEFTHAIWKYTIQFQIVKRMPNLYISTYAVIPSTQELFTSLASLMLVFLTHCNV